MKRYVHILVSGKVQGVCFRAATQKQAEQLNVQGCVRNLSSGEVEIQAAGESGAIAQLIAWCHKGPTFAKVIEVQVTDLVEKPLFSGFDVLRY